MTNTERFVIEYLLRDDVHKWQNFSNNKIKKRFDPDSVEFFNDKGKRIKLIDDQEIDDFMKTRNPKDPTTKLFEKKPDYNHDRDDIYLRDGRIEGLPDFGFIKVDGRKFIFQNYSDTDVLTAQEIKI